MKRKAGRGMALTAVTESLKIWNPAFLRPLSFLLYHILLNDATEDLYTEKAELYHHEALYSFYLYKPNSIRSLTLDGNSMDFPSIRDVGMKLYEDKNDYWTLMQGLVIKKKKREKKRPLKVYKCKIVQLWPTLHLLQRPNSFFSPSFCFLHIRVVYYFNRTY